MAGPTIVTSSSGTGTTVTYPASLAAGDTLVVFAAENGTPSGKFATGPTLTDANGVTLTEIASSGGLSAGACASGIWTYLVNGAQGATATLSDSSASSLTFAWLCLRISGAGASPVNVLVSSTQITGTTSFNWPSVTTTVPNTLVVLFGATSAPTSALDSSAVTSYTRDKFGRSTTIIGVADYSIAQAAAGANGAQVTTGAIASGSPTMDQYVVAFGSMAAGGASSRGFIIG